VADYAQAFDNLRRGNRLKRARDYADYRLDTFRAEVEALMALFDTDFFRQRAHLGSASERPIIIYGMPRSGTTLTEQILASHSHVHGGGELLFFGDLADRLQREARCQEAWPACLARFEPGTLAGLAQEYETLLRRIAPKARRVSNKLPHNFMHLGLIQLLFPRARYLHCRRHPLDNCLSIYFQNFTGNHPYAYDLETLGGYYREYRRLTDHWKAVLPAPILEVDYEETVTDLEGSARRLLDFCGLPWEEQCLAFHETRRAIKTASVWQTRQKVYTHSVARWRHYEPWLAPLREALGPLSEP